MGVSPGVHARVRCAWTHGDGCQRLIHQHRLDIERRVLACDRGLLAPPGGHPARGGREYLPWSSLVSRRKDMTEGYNGMRHTQKLCRLLAMLRRGRSGPPWRCRCPRCRSPGLRGYWCPGLPPPSWSLPTRRWSTPPRWVWCGLPWSWLRHRWVLRRSPRERRDTIEAPIDTASLLALTTIPTGAAGKGHAPERPCRLSWSRDPEGFFSSPAPHPSASRRTPRLTPLPCVSAR